MSAEVTLTTFMDFVVASGTKKITCVRDAKKQYDRGYDPRFDFYRPLREGIIEMHKKGREPSSLSNVLANLTDQKKISSYPKCIDGYCECLGNKPLDYTPSRTYKWHSNGLVVRVNPEVILAIGGKPHAVKLYFKADPLPLGTIAPMLRMIEMSVPKTTRAKPTIIDLQHAKMYTREKLDPSLDALLAAEAASFTVLWESLA